MATSLIQWKEPSGWPATNPATPDVRNDRVVTAFDQTTSESIYLEGILPRNYAGGTLKLLCVLAASATSGDVDVDVSVERMVGLDLDTDSFDTVNSTNGTTVPGTSGQEFQVEVTLTNKDSLAAGEPFRLKVARDIADTLAADLHSLLWELFEA